MLGKLMKYEFRATGRTYLPLFALLLFLTVTNRISLSIALDRGDFSGVGILQGVLMLVYVLAIVLVAAAVFIITIQRFYRNLLGDEGYLMFTLPVKKGNLVLSKLLVSSVWTIASSIFCAVSILILSTTAVSWSEIVRSTQEAFSHFAAVAGFSAWHMVIIGLLALIVSTLMGIMMFYAAMAIGHLANKHRFLKSVGAYMGVSFVLQMVSAWIGELFFTNYNWMRWFEQPTLGSVWGLSLIVILFVAALGAGLFFLTQAILNRRLNLE